MTNLNDDGKKNKKKPRGWVLKELSPEERKAFARKGREKQKELAELRRKAELYELGQEGKEILRGQLLHQVLQLIKKGNRLLHFLTDKELQKLPPTKKALIIGIFADKIARYIQTAQPVLVQLESPNIPTNIREVVRQAKEVLEKYQNRDEEMKNLEKKLLERGDKVISEGLIIDEEGKEEKKD